MVKKVAMKAAKANVTAGRRDMLLDGDWNAGQ